MLLLGRGAQQINGITIYPDHENPQQFWYLSGSVRLSERNNNSVFTLIKYNKKAKDKGAKGGGFVTFEVNIGLSEMQKQRILSQLPADSVLAPVPFDKGTVKCLALDIDKEQILGAASPSLYDENSAIFSLTLNENQTAILEQAYNGNATPIGVVYELEYTAMRPTLDVKLEADLKRVYEELQFGIGGSGFVEGVKLDAAIETGFQNLIQEGAIKIEVFTFTDDEDVKIQKETALKLFMDTLLKDWFVPTLTIPKITDEDDKDDLPLDETTNEKPDGAATAETKPEDGIGEDVKDTVDAAEDIAEEFIPKATLKLRYVKQEEQKKVTYTYRGAQTTSKNYFPQGFFSRLLSDVDNKQGIILADLDDPFFRTINITVQAPQISYEKYGIQSINFAAKYPNREIESHIFDENNNAAQIIEFAMNKNLDTSYKYQVQYNFLPDSGWEGDRVKYEVPWTATEDRTQVLLPHEHIDFLDITATLESNFYWGQIQEARVYLSYKSRTGWSKQKMLRFIPGAETEQHWKLRLSDRQNRNGEDPSYSYYIEYKMADDSTQKTDQVTTKVPAIVVNDLIKKKLPVKFISQLAANERAFIDIVYEDTENNFRWDKSLEMSANNSTPVELEIPLANPSQQQFQYTITYVKADGRRLSQSFPLGIYHRSPIIVNTGSDLEVNLSPDNINWELVRTVTVNLLYQDPQNNLQKTEAKTFNRGDKSFVWKVVLANQSLRTYQWRAAYYMKDTTIGEQGLVRYPESKDDWNTTDETVIFLDRYQPKSNKPETKEGELEVEVSLEDIDWDVVRRITVNLRYQDPQNNIDESETKTFRSGDDSFIWNITAANKNLKSYQWQATFYMKDSSLGEQGKLYYPQTKGEWVSSTDSVIFISNYQNSSSWVGFSLVDEDGKPVNNEVYRVTLPNGTVREGRSDAQGRAKIEGIAMGNCTISFPNIDANDWHQF